jgi:cell division initiation protein
MRIAPIDIKNKGFKRRLIGYDTKEVSTFLEVISDELESIIKENIRLREMIERLKREVDGFRRNEKVFRENIVNIEKFVKDIKENAEKEAEIIISQAELQAERILSSAQSKLDNIKKDIYEYKIERTRIESSLRSILENHLKLLEVKIEENENVETLEDKIKFIKKE